MERSFEFEALPQHLKDWVTSKAIEGRYRSTGAFIEELLERVRAKDAERDQSLADAAIQRGIDSMARGEGKLLDDVLDELYEKHGLRRGA